jgi:chromate transporter
VTEGPGRAPPGFLRLAGHPLRWQLLTELGRSDRQVRELTSLLGQPQSLVSYHLGQLKAGGLVSARRSSADRRDAYYRIDLTRCTELLTETGRALHPGLELVPAPADRARVRTRVLFLCTGNSARSQLAEALLEQLGGDAIEAASAGSQPKPLHPDAVLVMREHGLDISGRRAKHLDTFAGQRFGYVVSLCDRVREVCPEFPGHPQMIHWSIADPSGEPDTRQAFRRVAAELRTRIGFLLGLIGHDADRAGGLAVPGQDQVSLATVLREWGRIGCIGFGGPPAHIALLRQLCVDRRQWLDAQEFEDAIGACNLLPGPASTELAIFCAWRVRGRMGALAGGLAFIVPGLACILALSALFLAGSPPLWVQGAGAGAGAAVAAVAVQAGWSLAVPSWTRARTNGKGRRFRWVAYLLAGAAAAATIGPWLVLVLLGCGVTELAVRAPRGAGPGADGTGTAVPNAAAVGDTAGRDTAGRDTAGGTAAGGKVPGITVLSALASPVRAAATVAGGGVLVSVAWVAFKVGALSFGGGFVIIPLMRADAVGRHWMTSGQFLNAVALGQITPGPVVLTVSAVGYAAAGVGGGLLAALVAFSPSFAFVLGGARYFSALRTSRRAQSFLDGAGPAAIGAILGSAILLAAALSQPWQYAVLAGAAVLLLGLRRGVVVTLLAAAATGLGVALAGGPLPH